MRMLSTIAAAALGTLVLSTPAMAKEGQNQSFEHEGYRYDYQVIEAGASTKIAGKRYPGGSTFSLTVRDGVVTGTSDGRQVRFKVADAAGATGPVPSALSMK